ncbi:MAG: T9SS type B sorting domain-containing protein [Bacteroidota bacterium]
MKKNVLLFVFVSFISHLINTNLYAHSVNATNFITSPTAVSPPIVTSPIYYCQGSPATALTATPTAGNSLVWFGTSAAGGVSSPIAPTPSTATVGTTSYYVSETDGSSVSTRSRIDVIVVADNGSSILGFQCDPSKILLPSTKYDAVYFDWGNTVGLPNQYTYSYSVNGGAPVFGTTAPTHLQVSGLSQGQSVTITVWHTSYPCDRTDFTCNASCLTFTTPTFDPIGPICAGDRPPPLPAASKEGIQGTWSPAVINNTTAGSYVFTPNANQCANPQTINIVVDPNSPGFSDFDICSGSGATTLSNVSPTGVTGTWTPTNIVDDMTSASYTFTPDPGQCATPQTINVTVVPSNMLTDFDWTVSEAFAENQKVTIAAIAPGGNYLYQLDAGPFQSSPVFEYVASGTHSVTVIDQAGCSVPITKTDIIVVNYPKYFTPNNDGYNDNWNISELSAQTYAYIRIFDRYGKLLKQISPNGSGWNGTYNGHIMPADDYWFVIHYMENNSVKEFKSHFSLKR